MTISMKIHVNTIPDYWSGDTLGDKKLHQQWHRHNGCKYARHGYQNWNFVFAPDERFVYKSLTSDSWIIKSYKGQIKYSMYKVEEHWGPLFQISKWNLEFGIQSSTINDCRYKMPSSKKGTIKDLPSSPNSSYIKYHWHTIPYNDIPDLRQTDTRIYGHDIYRVSLNISTGLIFSLKPVRRNRVK